MLLWVISQRGAQGGHWHLLCTVRRVLGVGRLSGFTLWDYKNLARYHSLEWKRLAKHKHTNTQTHKGLQLGFFLGTRPLQIHVTGHWLPFLFLVFLSALDHLFGSGRGLSFGSRHPHHFSIPQRLLHGKRQTGQNVLILENPTFVEEAKFAKQTEQRINTAQPPCLQQVRQKQRCTHSTSFTKATRN